MDESKGRYCCIAHGCNNYATLDNVCWFHDQTPPAEWAAVTTGMKNHDRVLKLVELVLTSAGREKLEGKFGDLVKAAEKAAESFNDADLMPKDSDYLRERRNLDGSVTPIEVFSWYSYGTRVRAHLLALFRQKKELRLWYREAA